MIATFQLAAAMADLVGVDFATPAREPRKPSATATAIRTTGKPPMNGKREVARRLRHIERGDVLNHPTVAARELVFTP